ncbi:hypothetical protein K4L06_09650 [Lysobacter sp. BMK333-48F3]|uniref:hypothetical protein n=1 Tax=Lysobacter sp. BMK333-48F3 TaxID=2867962 RepID=UPI001C8BCC5E|nr:hypothetical protein [Lysobacter sp. BMK333-48F3]MBX9401576.1 hypothetical protein [Lysobacter sp. BMK333-48F3]
MNRTPPPFDPSDDRDPAVASEWRLQERALRDERAGAPMEADDPRLAQYRLLSRALRAPVMEPIPYGFAEQVARRAQTAAQGNDRLERWLQQGLLAALVATGLAVAALGSAQWLPAFASAAGLLPDGSLSWGLVVAACCIVTWGWDGAMRSVGRGQASARAA